MHLSKHEISSNFEKLNEFAAMHLFGCNRDAISGKSVCCLLYVYVYDEVDRINKVQSKSITNSRNFLLGYRCMNFSLSDSRHNTSMYNMYIMTLLYVLKKQALRRGLGSCSRLTDKKQI